MPHLILNPHARLFRHRPGLLREVTRLARGRGQVHVTKTLTELQSIAKQVRHRVALCGGDGTFMEGVSALVRATGGAPPPMALIPAGTVGTVARQWGATGEVLGAVDRFLRLDSRAETRSRATLRIVADGWVRHGFTFGTGLVARFFQQYEACGAGGLTTAAGIFARVFAGSFWGNAYARHILDPLPCSLCVEGQPLDAPAYSLIVSSVLREVGLGLTVTYRGSEDAGRPHLVASTLPARRLGPQAPRVLAGQRLRGPGFDGLVESFAVNFPDKKTGPYVFDGDLFQAHEIQVSAGPRITVVTLPRP